eukprot:8532897-Alexandrium_andersonii.AAC.1
MPLFSDSGFQMPLSSDSGLQTPLFEVSFARELNKHSGHERRGSEYEFANSYALRGYTLTTLLPLVFGVEWLSGLVGGPPGYCSCCFRKVSLASTSSATSPRTSGR